MRRMILLLAAVLAFGTASARIGQPTGMTTDALQEAGLTEVNVQEQGGIVFGLSGTAAPGEEGIAEAAAAAGIATGLAEGIAAPVTEYLTAALPELAGRGEVSLGVAGAWILSLDVSEDLAFSWRIERDELPEAAFLPARHTLGAPDASIVIREFSDYQCPHCANFALNVLPGVITELVQRGDVRFEFHHLPLVTIHANALPAAEAAECVAAANGPESFWMFSDLVFERQAAWAGLPSTADYFLGLAQEGGMNTEGVAECIISRAELETVRVSASHAVEVLGINGTPGVFVGGYRISDWTNPAAYEEAINMLKARTAGP